MSALRHVRWVLATTWWQVSYWIRPYDMLADRRRWFWQPAQQCRGCWVCAPADGEEQK